jgi:DnaK suppressor protein
VFEVVCNAQRRQALRRLASLAGDFHEVVAGSRDSTADDEHDPEGATIAFERSQVTSLGQQVQKQLAEIEAAFDRLSVGAYGTCEYSAQSIPSPPTSQTRSPHLHHLCRAQDHVK